MISDFIDVFEYDDKAIVWIQSNGKNEFLEQEFPTRFFYKTSENKRLLQELNELGAYCYPYVGRDFATNNQLEVLCVELKSYSLLRKAVNLVNKYTNYQAELFNADISFQQRYLFEYKLAPLTKVFIRQDNNKIVTITPIKQESYDSVFPKLKIIEVEVHSNGADSWIRANNEYFRGNSGTTIKEFMDYYNTFDADIVLTHGGDKYLIEYLQKFAEKFGYAINFGRYPDKFSRETGKSYFTYGRVIRKQPKKICKGRLHFDAQSFVFQEGALDGVFELAKTTHMPLQLAIRKSPGTSITNLQMFYAYKNGFLIPTKKNHYEKYKTALKLLEVDKGGFIYTPIIGLHENVIELDFSSLYPSIMVLHNISPETIHCTCCTNKVVPEAGYTICEKKKGLIPQAIKTVLEKRLYYKHKKAVTKGEEREKYKRMSNALKWLLVTSFGYTGYRNARFGRIEAHESITAFARDKLLIAARECEKKGFRVLHGITDSLWITKPQYSLEEIDTLIKTITTKTGVEINLEGFLRWIVFLPSINNPNIGTLNHFYGVYTTDEQKVRGIAMRRSDTPQIVKKMQAEQIEILTRAKNKTEFTKQIPLVIEKLKEYISQLENKLTPLENLEFTRVVSKELNEYKGIPVQKIVLQQLQNQGINVNPGEKITYTIRNTKSKHALMRYSLPEKAKRTDVEKYTNLLIKSTEEILKPFGHDYEIIKELTQTTRQTTLENHLKKVLIQQEEKVNQ